MGKPKNPWSPVLRNLLNCYQLVVAIRRKVAPEVGLEPAPPWKGTRNPRTQNELAKFVTQAMLSMFAEIESIRDKGIDLPAEDRLDLQECVDRLQKSLAALPTSDD